MQDFVIKEGILVRYQGDAEEVRIPEGVKEIGEYCFQGSTTLRGIILPCSLWRIRANAFDGCSIRYIWSNSWRPYFCIDSLKNCRVDHIYASEPSFNHGCGYREGCIHSEKNRDVWDFCKEFRPGVKWRADWLEHWERHQAKEAEIRLPELSRQLDDYKKSNQSTLYWNQVAINGTPVWMCMLVFALIAATIYLLCRDIGYLQQYYLNYIIPVIAGILVLLLVKLLRLIWKSIRFRNKTSNACIVRDTLAELDTEIAIWKVRAKRDYQEEQITKARLKRSELEAEFHVYCNGYSYDALDRQRATSEEKVEWDGTDWDGTVWGIGKH